MSMELTLRSAQEGLPAEGASRGLEQPRYLLHLGGKPGERGDSGWGREVVPSSWRVMEGRRARPAEAWPWAGSAAHSTALKALEGAEGSWDGGSITARFPEHRAAADLSGELEIPF